MKMALSGAASLVLTRMRSYKRQMRNHAKIWAKQLNSNRMWRTAAGWQSR